MIKTNTFIICYNLNVNVLLMNTGSVLAVTLAIVSIASIAVLGNTDPVFAGIPSTQCDSIASGPWTDTNTWSCNGEDSIPDSSINAFIFPGHTVTVSDDVSGDFVSISGGDPLGTLIINDGASLTARSFENLGDTFNFGTLNVDSFANSIFDTFHNRCTGVVNISFFGVNGEGFLIINHGVFNIGDSFFNLGIFQNSGTINGVFSDEFEGGVLESISSICGVVGGELLAIDSTALVLAGLQTSAIWMLPVLAGVAGSAFGILYIKSRRN